ncbi:MAG TPA: hypothetical protein VEC57_08985 [Candidatus Limnocylindrales bacterium]|nr:hypothetical protein [Candidatus Limnocylindrales bacterium]
MEPHDEELIKTLVPANEELRSAYETHRKLDAEVQEMAARSHLSPEEELHRKELQKLKLAEKDKIMRILAEYRRSAVSA